MVAELAARHGVSPDTVVQLGAALRRGGGRQAQFDIAELGGMGQWLQGGKVMVGDMFNFSLKARVDALCNDLASAAIQPASVNDDWPSELGQPAAQGAQNDMRYAVFPASQRLAVMQGAQITIYDTTSHQIGGIGQAQGADQILSITSQHGTLPLSALPVITPQAAAEQPKSPEPDFRLSTPDAPMTPATDDQIIALIERLAELHTNGVLTESEFSAKKAELLARL